MSVDSETPAVVYLNGKIVPLQDAKINVFDRGFLFGDGVYELVRVFSCVPLAMNAHVKRLGDSLKATRIAGFDPNQYHAIVDQLLTVTDLDDACIYLQVTRGVGPDRNHLPDKGTPPTVFATIAPSPSVKNLSTPQQTRAILHPDERWMRCEIKAITLLPNVLAMLDAHDHSATEAILHRDGFLTEGTSSNVFLVIDGAVITPPVTKTHSILHGTMRSLTIQAAIELGLTVKERQIPVAEVTHASEIALTSSRRLLHVLSHLDDTPLDSPGPPGPVFSAVFTRMRDSILDVIKDRNRAIKITL